VGVMDFAFPIIHSNEKLIFETKEHVDLYFHTLSHFIIHDCKENIFSLDYFSLVSSLKKKLNLDPMELVKSLNRLYEYYQKEKSLLNIQFLPFCTDSTDGLFQILDPSNSVAMDTLSREFRIDTSSNDVRRFLEIFKKRLHHEYHSFFKDNREEIQRYTIDKDALYKLSDLCMVKGAEILSVLYRTLKKVIYVYLCPSLTEHARMMERNGYILIAAGDLRTEEAVVPRFLNIIHEASHRIVDGPVVKKYFRILPAALSEDAEKIHLLKEISVIYFNKKLISKYNPEFTEHFERLYNLEKLIKHFVKKGEIHEKEQFLENFLSVLFKDIFSYSYIHS
jgi:hypothetical protein